MPLTNDRPLVFPALWGHERAWFVIDPSASEPSRVRRDFAGVAATTPASAWRRSGAILAGWATFGACAAAIPIAWAALRISPEWAPVAAIVSVVAFVAAIVLGAGAYTAIVPGMPPRPPQHVEVVPDFVAAWADDVTSEDVLWEVATAIRRAVDLRDIWSSDLLYDALGAACWVDDEVLAPAMLIAWRRELARISEIAPGLVIPYDLKPHRPDDLRGDPSLTA